MRQDVAWIKARREEREREGGVWEWEGVGEEEGTDDLDIVNIQ